MRTTRLLAVSVNHEGVVADRETVTSGNSTLSRLDLGIDEFLNTPTIKTQDVIVMSAGVQLEHRHALGEVVTRDEAGGLELRENAVNRRKTDVFAQINEPTIDILGR